MTRTIPEKTLEHWCSIHLTYRYRAKLRMWWPTSGADIHIEQGRVLLGKRFWLELKVPEWDPNQGQNGRHTLKIDLDQLEAYNGQPVPVYYVFPIPVWLGVLGDAVSAPWLTPLHRSDLGYQSHSAGRWFAEWTWVVSGRELTRILNGPLVAKRQGQRSSGLVTLGHSQGGNFHPARGLARPSMVRWRRFWELMERCGGDDLPAQFLLPANRNGGGDSVSRDELVSTLRDLPEGINPTVTEALVYSPGGEPGRYEVTNPREALVSEHFAWSPTDFRGLAWMTPQALTL